MLIEDVRGDSELRFVRVKHSFVRATRPKYAPGHQTGFADGFPFLLTLDSSLAAVNKALPTAIPMNRFRPKCVRLLCLFRCLTCF